MHLEYDKQGNPVIIRSEVKDEADTSRKNPIKFYNIPYLRKEVLYTFGVNEEVWIEEKIDGTNVSCLIDSNGEFKCYGRRYELGTWYTNQGAYNELLKLEDKVREYCNGFVLYFEWLVTHHVRYSEDKLNKLYLIGVRDISTGKYLTPDKVYEIADRLGLDRPCTFYHGAFIDWDNAKKLVGKSEFGAKQGEGVIVKAFDDKNGIKMVKVVADDFREVMKFHPEIAEAKMRAEINKRERAKQIVTDARINKQLYVLRDEGILTFDTLENLSTEQKNLAIKHIGKMIYTDCIKEEAEFVLEFGKDFGKYSFMLSKQYINSL